MMGNISRQIPMVNTNEPQAVLETLLNPAGGPARFAHTSSAWLAANAALVTITIALLIATALVLRRHDGG